MTSDSCVTVLWCAAPFVTGEVVHHDQVTRPQFRHQHLLHEASNTSQFTCLYPTRQDRMRHAADAM